MKSKLLSLSLLLMSIILNAQNTEAPSWIDYTTKRANNDMKNSILLDYSYAGYHFSEKALPDVSSWNTISVVDYGATPNDDVYDDAGIQAAIDAAEAANVPTIVFFPAGKYLVSSEQTRFTPIEVNSSNIVLKGAGTGPNGTEIYADKMGDTSLKWNTQWNFIFIPKSSGNIVSDIKKRINRGDKQIEVADGGKFSVGMPVVVNQHEGVENIAVNMPGLTMKSEWTEIHKTGMRVTEKNIIEAINGNVITLKSPVNCFVTADISRAYLERFEHIEEVGVEDILFTSGWKEYPEEFVHHKNDIVDYAWRALQFDGVRNGWIKNVEFRDWNECLNVNSSLAVTVEGVKFSGKQGHVSSQATRSTGILFKNCEDLVPDAGQGRGGQWHGPGMQVRSTGCVYLNFIMQHGQFVDFHGYQPYGNLLDNIKGGIVDRNGGATISQPHSGPDLCFWNFEQNSDYTNKAYNFWDLTKSTQSYFAHPKFIGFMSPGANVTFKNVGINELQGTQVYPKSLFDAQLQLRLYDSYMSASSEKLEGLAKFANDNKTETAWESEGAGAGQWLMLDFGIEKRVSAAILSELSPIVNGWKLEYWNGTQWGELKVGKEIGTEKTINFSAINTRKIRFLVESMLSGQESMPVALTAFKTTFEEVNTFTVLTTSESCVGKKNGKVVITASANNDYIASINGKDYNFTTSITIENLIPGTYDLCIKTLGKGFEQCYTVTIEGGVNISGKIQVVNKRADVSINLGTAPYTVYKNGAAILETYQSSFSVPVTNGDQLKVSSKAACEGVIAKRIDLQYEIKAYPNPSNGLFELYIPDGIKTVDVEIYTIHSQLIAKKVYAVNEGKVDLNIEDKPSGVYILKVNGEKPVFIKVIKR